MKRILLSLVLLVVLILWSSCRKDFETIPSNGRLEFSRDTIYLDTVFTNIGSATYTFKVYNRSDDDIRIPVVSLGQGQNSRYRLNVDGVAGKTFENVEILAKDSIFVFVETTVAIDELTASGTEFLYTDAIAFDTGENEQEVALVTLVKDAVFLFPQRFDDGTEESLLLGIDDLGNEIRISGFFLEDDELVFTNEKPYVIYGYAGVGNGKTLTVEAGARVHFHKNSGLLVGNNGTLLVNGSLSTNQELLENEVIFEGDRLEPEFSNVPGQWGTVWLTAGSTGHEINYLTLRNATVGILMDRNDGIYPTLQLKNTQIHNTANVGLWGRTAFIDAENLVIGNAGQASLYCNIGGRYQFRHITVANYWRNSFRDFPAVLVDNFVDLGENGIFSRDLIEATFQNSIIYGNNNLEFFATGVEGVQLNYKLENTLLQFNDFNQQFINDPRFDFSNTSLYTNVILNENPNFLDTQNSLFTIGEASAANSLGATATANLVPLDLLGVSRVADPDSGAYQSSSFEDN
ncbi:hypothetical protein [Ascidiimonas sp. W6]|uniref:hypothetical protein n=1 Tax=Ascidiimonas meishanensis TaxID=3128903 RepID=UPI0030ED3539